MDKEQIQKVMAIIRPAIWALYGRRPLFMIAYTLDPVSGFRGHGEFDVIDKVGLLDDSGYFKVKVAEWGVTHLSWIEV